MSLNYTPSQKQRRRVISACLLVAAAFTAIAVLDSRAEDWKPLSLVFALVAFNVLSELLASRDQTQSPAPWIITSTAPLVLAMTLLGPAPALAIGFVGLAVDGVRRTVPPCRQRRQSRQLLRDAGQRSSAERLARGRLRRLLA